MYQRPVIAILMLFAAAAAATEVYKWVDEDGVIHYSDQPNEGAEVVNLPESNTATFATRRPPTSSSAAAASNDAEQPFSYESLTIQTPSPEETLWNIQGTVSVTLNLQPSLRQGHRVRVYFDGEPQLVGALQFQLTEVWRGEHNLQAEVLDSSGTLMIRSDPIRFFVQQTSVIN